MLISTLSDVRLEVFEGTLATVPDGWGMGRFLTDLLASTLACQVRGICGDPVRWLI